VVATGVLFIDWIATSRVGDATQRPLCGRRVILASHNCFRAPVAQSDRAAAF
jgi:hypothetical protein